MMSGRWLRIAPLDSSTPLHTMSYWKALIVSGSCVSSASSSPCGIENGLWLKTIFFASSSHSYMGKSVIQQKRKAFFSTRSSPRRAWSGASPPMVGNVAPVADEEDAVARSRPGDLGEPTEAVGVEELRDRAARDPLAEGEPAEPRSALFLRPSLQAIEEAPRPRRRSRSGDRAHDRATRRPRRRTTRIPSPRRPRSRRRSRADSSDRACPSRTLPSPRHKGMRGNGAARRPVRPRIPRTRRAAPARWPAKTSSW